MSNWIQKEGYDTNIVATEDQLSSSGVEIQLFRFRQGKFEHYHKRKTEFFYFTGGSGKVVIDGKEQLLEVGTMLLIHPNTRHTFINESEEKVLEGIMVKTNNDPQDTYRD